VKESVCVCDLRDVIACAASWCWCAGVGVMACERVLSDGNVPDRIGKKLYARLESLHQSVVNRR